MKRQDEESAIAKTMGKTQVLVHLVHLLVSLLTRRRMGGYNKKF